jgi:bifunctional non-homologous end joining protein LigD
VNRASARSPARRSGRRALPAFVAPQLATLVDAPPAGDGWLHETKFDGYRILCRLEDGDVRLLSRNGKDWTARFAPIADRAARLPARSALIDGEVAVTLDDGVTSFNALQNAIGGTAPDGLAYHVFDLLHLDGEDLTSLPLEERKTRLKRLVRRAATIRYSDHVVGHGEKVFAEACRLGLEGIIAKRRDAPYVGGRGRDWLKVKCVREQVFLIGGFNEPQGSRTGIGALLLGVQDERRGLLYAGKVGTGFTARIATDLRRRLDRLEQKTCPFATRPPGATKAHWVRPTLVGEVEFTEWTNDGRLRHPSWKGLRVDKGATEVVRERAAASRTPTPDEMAGVRITHPDRVLYPPDGPTKRGLAEFYASIAEWILPHLRGRPTSLVRCPEGLAGPCFYQKHTGVWAPATLRRVRIQEKKKVGEYLIADDLPGLIGLVQIGILEIHTWNATAERLERPDRVVIDLDPADDVPWRDVVSAARLVRKTLGDVGLESFVKTTGGKGLHVVAPFDRGPSWDDALGFSRAVATSIADRAPRRFTVNMAKADRGGRIFLDYLRNLRGSTSVAAYSTRAKPGAPVSTPLTWDELSPRRRSDYWTVENLPRRLATLREDPWAAYWRTRQKLPSSPR